MSYNYEKSEMKNWLNTQFSPVILPSVESLMDQQTWDALMKRNSCNVYPSKSSSPAAAGPPSPSSPSLSRPTLTDNRIIISNDDGVETELDVLAPCETFGKSRLELHLQDPCNDQAGWMDFLQILVHQHAKTIVTLQDLTQEVEKLKDFRSSFISSITGELSKSSSAGPPVSVSHLHHHHGGSKQDVWTSSPNKFIDSGFSTETKESGNQKSEEDDPLYSLLDLIQTKVSNSTTNPTNNPSCPSCTCKPVSNGTRASANNLGKLDSVLSFKSGIEEAIHLDKPVIRAILREVDTVELQRQVLFAAAKIKTLESHLSSLSHEERNTSRLASKYLALSHENEQLRFKLKEQEIQLEGTKAKLRILERNHSLSSAVTKPSLGGSGSVAEPCPGPQRHPLLHSTTTTSILKSAKNVSTPPPHHPSPGVLTIQSDISQPRIESSFPNLSNPNDYSIEEKESNIPTPVSTVVVRKWPSHEDSVSATSATLPLQTSRVDVDSNLSSEKCSGKSLSPHNKLLHEYPTAVVTTLALSKSTGRPLSKIPTTIKPFTARNARLGGVGGLVSSTPSSSSSFCKSPGSSLSSKSSIPIPIMRLKQNNGTSKKVGSNFWANWFNN